MELRTLGRTGIQISPIGLGCWQFSQGKGFTGGMWAVLDQKSVDAIVEAAMRGGMNWFDTAQAYGNGRSEQVLSTALQHLQLPPGRVVIATKWLPIMKTAGNLLHTINTRLDNLRPYSIDLYQVHVPYSLSPIPAQMQAMALLQREGKVRSIGVSNFSASQMERASRALETESLVLASNQVSINLLDRRIETNGVLETARGIGATLIALSPLAQGLLSGRFHEKPELAKTLPFARRSRLSPASRAYMPENLVRTRPLIDALRAIAATHEATPAQVALAWLVTRYGDTVVAIPGASRAEQASENAAAMDLRLTEEETGRLDEVSRPLTKR
jgi:aryl-alcohol dehydrogenase-like predicted oxidoreductase